MIVKGIWKGQYKYDNKVHQQLKGVDATNFEIDITTIDDKHFTGTVQDDLSTGGTEGRGEISGRIIGNAVEFVKQMPVLSILNGKTGVRKTYNRKHRKIYYTGTFSDDGKTISGRWKFKAGFVLVGLMLILGSSNGGTWTMKLIE